MDFILQAIHWDGKEELFSIGSFAVRYYSLCWLIAFAVSYYLMLKVFIREGKTQEDLDKFSIYMFLGTLIGARLGHCLFYEFDYYIKHPLEMILPFRQVNGEWKLTGFMGLASHGAAIGLLVGLYLYSKKTKTNFLWITDRLILVVPLAGAFVRLGNFFNSEIIGKVADPNLPWAVVFTKEDQLPRHPGQLYEAVGYVILFVILWILYRKNQNPKPGLLFGIFLIGLFGIRFIVEFFKENQEAFEDNMLINMGQLLSVPFILAGIYLVFRKPKNTATAPVKK
ncbi:prolipoprotein diacylglyceryl transferase [Parapusillimonas sp. SGNA-6]|uniref:prolipoprotein diacylglyceryl transferase n=1 Tax=Parapedobacter sp. SGR-10 TaxID=2710879 RepID=UPI0013D69F1D|nr:prolipoprotein diacylglyceryl transferase [Parapedobacter sp. SGR-10]NGF57077.1 prolipoprotein diacylglyceryl transferase [Parapedobacter sp. SGR-10]NGM90273.1 prolipoprotein diacylglyceryl transferase [Parapusillimonas sp. SGNA-6]